MGFWQIVMIVYIIFNIIIGFIADGIPKSGKYSASDIITTNIILAFVLYMGGFWK